jgi:hypothetical protein
MTGNTSGASVYIDRNNSYLQNVPKMSQQFHYDFGGSDPIESSMFIRNTRFRWWESFQFLFSKISIHFVTFQILKTPMLYKIQSSPRLYRPGVTT